MTCHLGESFIILFSNQRLRIDPPSENLDFSVGKVQFGVVFLTFWHEFVIILIQQSSHEQLACLGIARHQSWGEFLIFSSFKKLRNRSHLKVALNLGLPERVKFGSSMALPTLPLQNRLNNLRIDHPLSCGNLINCFDL